MRILIIFAFFLSILVLGVFFLFDPDKRFVESKKKKSPTPYENSEIMNFKTDPTLIPLEDSKLLTITFDAQDALIYYERWAQYPPFSRPLHKGQTDLIDPYNADKPAIGVIAEPAKGCKQSDDLRVTCDKPAVFSEISCKLSPEKIISVGKEDFTVELYCFGKQGVLVDIKKIVPKVYTILFNNEIHPSFPPLAFGDDGKNEDKKANDKIFTFLIRPASQDWGDMFLEVDLEVEGKKHNQRTTWYSTPHIVAEFKDGIIDRIEDGHLVFSVPIQIYKKGYYHIEANLQGVGEEKDFVSTAVFDDELNTGTQMIKLTFWGKVIRDSNVEGPYLLRELRGKRNNSPVTPDMVKQSFLNPNIELKGEHKEPLWEFIKMAPYFTTQFYTPDQFSKEVWNSPEKAERIDQLESMSKGNSMWLEPLKGK